MMPYPCQPILSLYEPTHLHTSELDLEDNAPSYGLDLEDNPPPYESQSPHDLELASSIGKGGARATGPCRCLGFIFTIAFKVFAVYVIVFMFRRDPVSHSRPGTTLLLADSRSWPS